MKRSALDQAGFLFYPPVHPPHLPPLIARKYILHQGRIAPKTHYKKSLLLYYNKSSGKIHLSGSCFSRSHRCSAQPPLPYRCLSQPPHRLPDPADSIVDLFRRRPSAESQAQRTMRQVVVDTQGLENITRFHRCRSTSRTR